MAKDAENREDLLAEAKTLVERIELIVTGEADPVVAGFRREGAFSVFFGPDPVFQFNSEKAIRRAFVDGLLFKSEAGRLARLERQRTAHEVVLVRHDLSAAEQVAFLSAAGERLVYLRDALANNAYQVVGQVPPEVDVVGRLIEWLQSLEIPVQVADSPRVK